MVLATPRNASCDWKISSDAVCAMKRGFDACATYSRPNAACCCFTPNSRTSTRSESPCFCTVPMTRPSAPSSRHRSNGMAERERAGGIEAYVSRGIMSNSRSKARSANKTSPIVFAAATVSASFESGMKSGTA